jgi:HAD superfamily hydrolase (TIGR01509 family)
MDNYAYIFDFDGVLFYTMEEHFQCYRQALEEYGVAIDRAQFYRQAGMKGVEQIAYFAEAAGVRVDPAEVYRRKGEIQKSRDPAAEPIKCNLDWLVMLKKNGNPVAIASGSSKPSILPVLERYGISIDVIVTSEDVKRGKPNPDLFLEAGRRLGAPPERCIVIEDSDAGVEAARAAGMAVLRYYDIQEQGGV